MQSAQRLWIFGILFAILFGAIWFSAAQIPSAWELSDFHVTFYHAVHYFLNGENVYLNAYPHPFNGREYPPYAPIWILYAFVPIGTWTLPAAEGLRVALDVAFIPFLAYLSARWAGLDDLRSVLLLAVAPWLLTEIHSGQITPVVLLGTLLCYWGVRKPNASMTAVGLWLALAKFNLVALVLLATIYFAWRQRILGHTLAILVFLIAIFSISNPWWFVDVARMYSERLATPRLVDSVLLFPFYPWGQIAVLGAGAILLVWFIWRYRLKRPTRWLWAMLAGASLIGALHTFIYDWQLLMLPLAWIACTHAGRKVVWLAYVYPVVWALSLIISTSIVFPPVAVVPACVLILMIAVSIRETHSIYANV